MGYARMSGQVSGGNEEGSERASELEEGNVEHAQLTGVVARGEGVRSARRRPGQGWTEGVSGDGAAGRERLAAAGRGQGDAS